MIILILIEYITGYKLTDIQMIYTMLGVLADLMMFRLIFKK